MRRGHREHRNRFAAAVLLVCVVPVDATDGFAPLDPGVRACAGRVLPAHTMVQKQAVKVVGATGWERASERVVYWKRSGDGAVKALFVVEAPVAERGLEVLVTKRAGEDPVLWVYTPDTGRARRMVGAGASNSVLGTDLTYEDAMHFETFLESGRTRRLPDAELEGHPVYVLETLPAEDRTAYGSIRTYVDRALCVPLLTEFVAPNGALRKSLVVHRDAVVELAGRAVPTRSVMLNHERGSRTEFVVSDVAIDVELPERLFSPAEIRKGH